MNESKIIEDEQITGEAAIADLSKWAFENMEGGVPALTIVRALLTVAGIVGSQNLGIKLTIARQGEVS